MSEDVKIDDKKSKTENKVLKAYDSIIDATSTYLRKILPHIFELKKK